MQPDQVPSPGLSAEAQISALSSWARQQVCLWAGEVWRGIRPTVLGSFHPSVYRAASALASEAPLSWQTSPPVKEVPRMRKYFPSSLPGRDCPDSSPPSPLYLTWLSGGLSCSLGCMRFPADFQCVFCKDCFTGRCIFYALIFVEGSEFHTPLSS